MRIGSALIALALAGSVVAADRSRAARAEFTRHNVCPSTGRVRGPCPGYEVDHIEPLCLGGLDAPSNMQWLSRDEHRIKTRRDIRNCRLKMPPP